MQFANAFAAVQLKSLAMKKIFVYFAFALQLFFMHVAAQQSIAMEPQLDLPRITIKAGMRRITAQVAVQPKEQAIGLMFRKTMPAHEGMIFAFPEARRQCFWMRNTLMPLSAAFLSEDGRIINIAEMQALSDTPHCSSKPAKYVLEMNKGWFKKAGLKAGDQLSSTLFQAQP